METQNICVNCKSEIALNFCPKCGQRKFKRIDAKYLKEEVQYALLHTNKGFFYTVKKLLQNPGKTAREFIEGNRVNHYKPILLAFVLSGISTFISYKILKMGEVLSEYMHQSAGLSTDELNGMMSSISSYMSIIILFLIPFFAVTTKIIYGRWGQNYFEHVIMNAFFYSLYSLFSILIIFPILYFFRENPSQFVVITYASILVTPLLFTWFLKGFYPDKSFGQIILKVIFTYILIFISYMLFSISVGVIYFINHKIPVPQP